MNDITKFLLVNIRTNFSYCQLSIISKKLLDRKEKENFLILFIAKYN